MTLDIPEGATVELSWDCTLILENDEVVTLAEFTDHPDWKVKPGTFLLPPGMPRR